MTDTTSQSGRERTGEERRLRWRERRDTLSAKRHRRRLRRRDVDRSGDYDPMQVEPNSASRGVHTRLAGAIVALSVTLVCIVSIVVTSVSTFSAIFAFTTGLASFGAAISLILSARHEEELHEFAVRLDHPELFDPMLTTEDDESRRERLDPSPSSGQPPPPEHTDGHT